MSKANVGDLPREAAGDAAVKAGLVELFRWHCESGGIVMDAKA